MKGARAMSCKKHKFGPGSSGPAMNTGSSTTTAMDIGNTRPVGAGGLLDGLSRRPRR
jgi:hypothetical protein